MQCIVQIVAGSRELLRGFDFYWWDGAQWRANDQIGLLDALVHRFGVKVGRLVPRAQFDSICARAEVDPALPHSACGVSMKGH